MAAKFARGNVVKVTLCLSFNMVDTCVKTLAL